VEKQVTICVETKKVVALRGLGLQQAVCVRLSLT